MLVRLKRGKPVAGERSRVVAKEFEKTKERADVRTSTALCI